MSATLIKAPEIYAAEWVNTESPIDLEQLLGKVVVIEAFQMLCPGCVAHGLPQAQRIASTFSKEDVIVFGLHTVFEHHEAQGTRTALEAFVHEYRIGFPVAIDKAASEGHIPQTMSAYNLRGTPSLILIDKAGNYRNQFFGEVSDMALGAQIMQLVGESASTIEYDKDAQERPKNNDDGLSPVGSPPESNGCAIN